MQGVHRVMDLRHLRAFAAIVDTGGFARAAAQLDLSQPALSRQILALEAELGVPLFDRIGRRALLTSEGEDLLRRSRRLLTDADSLGERARALKRGQTGLLRVGATPQVMETLLAGFLRGYQRRHPAVEVHLVEDGGVRLPGRLDRGDVHLCLAGAGDARFRWRLLGPMGGHLLGSAQFLAPYAEQFVEELVAYSRRAYPRPKLTRRAPPIPRPKEPPRLP